MLLDIRDTVQRALLTVQQFCSWGCSRVMWCDLFFLFILYFFPNPNTQTVKIVIYHVTYISTHLLSWLWKTAPRTSKIQTLVLKCQAYFKPLSLAGSSECRDVYSGPDPVLQLWHLACFFFGFFFVWTLYLEFLPLYRHTFGGMWVTQNCFISCNRDAMRTASLLPKRLRM